MYENTCNAPRRSTKRYLGDWFQTLRSISPVLHLVTSFGHCLQFLEFLYLLYRQYFAFVAVLQVIGGVAIGILVASLSDQHKKLVGLVNERRLVPIVDRGWVRAVSSHRLVPGDVIVLQRGRALVDMVLLRGNCIVEESMLSGEVWARLGLPRVSLLA